MRHKVRQSLFLTLALAFAGGLGAQGLNRVHTPAPLRSDEATLLKYEASQLRTLLSRCKKESTKDWAAWEQAPEGRGWVLRYEANASTGNVGSYARVAIDKRQAEWVDYQAIDGSQRLWLKLALPRDYARCRVVSNSAGDLRLEVLNRTQLNNTDLATAWAEKPQATTTCNQRARGLWLRPDGNDEAWPLCTGTQQAWASRIEALTREMYDQPAVAP